MDFDRELRPPAFSVLVCKTSYDALQERAAYSHPALKAPACQLRLRSAQEGAADWDEHAIPCLSNNK